MTRDIYSPFGSNSSEPANLPSSSENKSRLRQSSEQLSLALGKHLQETMGGAWLDTLRVQMEREGYSVGATVLSAAGIGAPHVRQRLYWVAIAGDERREGIRVQLRARRSRQGLLETSRRGSSRIEPGGDTDESGLEGRILGGNGPNQRSTRTSGVVVPEGVTSGFWNAADWYRCSDGRARCAEPGIFPMAYGTPSRVGPSGAVETQPRKERLMGYGNAIVAPLAATFIRAVMDIL